MSRPTAPGPGTDDTAGAGPDGTVTVAPDGARVEFRRRYATTPDDLWSAMTEPERARRWLGALHGDLRVGGTYELRMGEDVPDADDVAHGEVLACDPPHALELTWSFPGESTSHVRAQVDADGDGAVLTLVHTELQESAARGYGGGWHTLLDQLEDHVAGRRVRAWDELFDERVARYTV
ncbi:Activator of Hsp90 ATPase 1 family protein [Cellulomonas flavigena DSM 20109]|uniref:Activator of Hsp90 ATPase 1 family protein n=1 Tax=Cellulomonas flavigena (strain ATCC 482 / DSM 20109 / BCRC 11376 / JCM 18109 / NBRC 3775 / NCIMB 8073 / NRS 134) TaxID=446466 RepID=D5UDU9_CELFN|nr:SRPBCC family protein [Cellulomonas flavigena]ADG74507.1 Activator of Hsp90 ATPase 1 family protein [Cellulomonas flavigena DSM 20109]